MPDYAREIIRAVNRDASTEQVDRWIELRIMRQAILDRFRRVACVKSPAGAAYLEAPHVQHFADVYDQLRDSAQTADASIAALKRVVKTLE